MWETWEPARHFREEEFAAASKAWENPDWVEITLHSYRFRWGRALPDPHYDGLEASQMLTPPIAIPTTLLYGVEDGAVLPPSTEGKDDLFTAGYQRIVLPGVGHSVPLEQPEAVVKAVLEGLT